MGLKEWQLFLGLFAYSFFIRFPFFFRDYIDRDESTFILMGQSWVEGNLPYTELWDLKPPVTFLFFAGVIYFFGKSFFAIRLGGTILVAVSAFFTFKIGLGLKNKNVGIASALLVVLFFSLFGSMQGVMSEHICMAFFVPGVYLFLKQKGWMWPILSGLLFGLALMSKINVGYPLVFLFLITLWHRDKSVALNKRILQLLICGLALCSVILLTFLPYLITEQSSVWWDSVVTAPLAYSGAEDNSAIKAFPFVMLVLALLLFLSQRKLIDTQSHQIIALIAITIGLLLSFIQAGKANGHYLIQLYPFLIVLLVLAFSSFSVFKTQIFRTSALILLVLLPVETYAEFANIIRSKSEKDSYFNGEGISVPQYFKENQLTSDNVLFFEYHIGYWLLNTKPPSVAATHPSNILREELFPFMKNPRKKGLEELHYILEELKPEYIITRKNRRIFYSEKYTANFYAQLMLLKKYKVLDTVENAVIHKRLPIQ